MSSEIPGKQEIKRDALGRFPKGVSGNPKGVPKGRRRCDVVVREMFKEGKISQEEFVRSTFNHAINGNAKAMDIVKEWIDGPILQRLQIGEIPPEALIEFIRDELESQVE